MLNKTNVPEMYRGEFYQACLRNAQVKRLKTLKTSRRQLISIISILP